MNRVLSAFLLVLAASVAAAQSDSSSKVHLRRAVVEQKTLILDLRIDIPYHIYSVFSEGDNAASATKIVVDKPFEVAGAVVEPKPVHFHHDYVDDTTKEVTYSEDYYKHEGDITLRVPVTGSGSTLKGHVRVVACNADGCLPDGDVRFTATVTAGAPGSDTQPSAHPSAGPSVPDQGSGSDPSPGSRPSRKVVSNPKRLGTFEPNDPFSVVEISYPDPITSDRFDVRVVAQVGAGYHIYGFTGASGVGVATSFTVSKPDGAAPAVVLEQKGVATPDPKPKRRKEPLEDYDYFEGKVAFDVPIHAMRTPTGAAGVETAFTFRLTVEYQTCTMDHCLRPAEAVFELAANAVPGAGWAAPNASETVTGTTSRTSIGSADAVGLKAEFTTEPSTLEPGKSGDLVVRVRRADGKPFTGSVDGARLDLAQGQNLFGDGAATARLEADGSVTLRQPIRVAPEAREGTIAVAGRVGFGAFSGDFSGKVRIVSSLMGFILIAATAALLALLTPCVFPMIPVTISIFTKQAEAGQESPAKLGILYCVGIVASFTAIGAAFTALLGGDAANVFAQHWITQLVIAALFIFFALSLLGMFDLAVPAPIMAMVERTTTRRMELASAGHGASFTVLLMGLLFAITTFTCTAPFIGGLLAGAAASGWARPVIGMLVFSSVLAVPFFFLAIFPSQLKKLPKSGGWLNETKVVMGFIELSAAVKFLNAADLSLEWEFFTRNTCLAAWIAIFGMTGLYLIGVFRMPKDMPRQKTGVLAAMFSILFLTTTVYLTTGLNGKPLGTFVEAWLPPIEERFLVEQERGPAGPVTTRAGYDNRFKEDYESALAEAKTLNLPLFIDFTGFT